MGWIALLGPLIPTLVTQVEKLFGKKNGPTKLSTVLNAVTPILTNLVNAQALGGPMPPQADIVGEINAVVAKLFPAGTTYSAAADPLAQPVVIQAPTPAPVPVVPASPLVPPSSTSSALSSDQKISLVVALVKALIS